MAYDVFLGGICIAMGCSCLILFLLDFYISGGGVVRLMFCSFKALVMIYCVQLSTYTSSRNVPTQKKRKEKKRKSLGIMQRPSKPLHLTIRDDGAATGPKYMISKPILNLITG